MRTVFYMSLLGAILGALIGINFKPRALSLATPTRYPLPHQIPKYPGGVSLRFAMVHDVIHERFPKHGPAYYQHRNTVVQQQLAALPPGPPTPKTFRLMDDLAVGHVHLGEFDAAMTLMRDKLARQQAQNITGPDLYPTYANLGTAMMISGLVKLFTNQGGQDELKESLVWVKKSIEVNPQAHFGREVWQVVLGEFLLAAAKDPKLLTEFDMVGSKLGDDRLFIGRPTDHYFRVRGACEPAMEPTTDDERLNLRSRISSYRPAEEAIGRVAAWEDKDVRFDEPTLGIVGMWRYGAGANPHFALALARLMAKVGQRHIAWAAYERAARLADSAWPDKAITQPIHDHCRARQKEIESTLTPAERATLLPAFEADLKAGLDYQTAYQAYESDRIKAGADIDAPDFYADFNRKHGDIASSPGDADFTFVQKDSPVDDALAPLLLGAGLFALPTALISRSNARRRRLATTPPN